MANNIHDAILAGEFDFENAAAGATEVESSLGADIDLFKGEKLDSLRGVPFLIVGGTYREKFMDGKKTDFVTVIAVIASEKVLESRRVRVTGKEPWFPLQTFGINDGSTGIRRQLTSILHNEGHAVVVEEGTVIKESGSLGECSWDTRVSEWDKYNIGEYSEKVDKATGVMLGTWDFALEKGIYCPRGIRTSTYRNKWNKDVTTRYLA